MSRNRLRRSFTVETKARGRQAPAILPVRAPLLEQPSPAFPSLEAAAVFGGAPARRTDMGAEPAGQAASRRILPSLIEAPAPEPEAPEPAAREPRLPRVRRVKLPRAEAQAEAVVSVQPLPARIEPPQAKLAPDPLSQSQSQSQSQAKVPQAAAGEAGRRALRRAEKVLPLGERWKRRLPRVCW